MTVYFHANFGLNRKRMSSLLQLALQNPRYGNDQLAKEFGYGPPYASRYRSWLHKTGIIDLELPVTLTEKGRVVCENDPSFETLGLKWLLHWELCSDPYRAEAWYFFINEFLPKNLQFTKNDLLMGVTNKLRTHSEEHFGPGSEMNKVIVRKLLECYLEEYALADLGIIRQEDSLYIRQQPSGVGPFKSMGDLKKAFEIRP